MLTKPIYHEGPLQTQDDQQGLAFLFAAPLPLLNEKGASSPVRSAYSPVRLGQRPLYQERGSFQKLFGAGFKT